MFTSSQSFEYRKLDNEIRLAASEGLEVSQTSSLRRSFRLSRWSQRNRAGFRLSFLLDVVFLHGSSAGAA